MPAPWDVPSERVQPHLPPPSSTGATTAKSAAAQREATVAAHEPKVAEAAAVEPFVLDLTDIRCSLEVSNPWQCPEVMCTCLFEHDGTCFPSLRYAVQTSSRAGTEAYWSPADRS